MISQYFAPLKYAVRRVYNDIPNFLSIPFKALFGVIALWCVGIGFVGWVLISHQTTEIRSYQYDRIERYADDNCPGLVELTKTALGDDGIINRWEYHGMDDLMDECLDNELSDHRKRMRSEFIENINKM